MPGSSPGMENGDFFYEYFYYSIMTDDAVHQKYEKMLAIMPLERPWGWLRRFTLKVASPENNSHLEEALLARWVAMQR